MSGQILTTLCKAKVRNSKAAIKILYIGNAQAEGCVDVIVSAAATRKNTTLYTEYRNKLL